MAIFTPESKFMSMMKTTLNTNKYFMENNVMDRKYYEDKNISTDIEEEKIDKNNDNISIYSDIANNSNIKSGIAYNPNNIVGIIDCPDEVNNKYNEFISFSEQQIKINKQAKNNFDRLNKKIVHNTDKIIKNSSELKYSIIKSIKDSDLFVEQKLIITEQNIDKVICEIIDSRINKLKMLIGINTLINIALFAYLIFCIIK